MVLKDKGDPGDRVDESTGEVLPAGSGRLARPPREVILAQFRDLVSQVPEAPADDGLGIIFRALQAQTWEDLDSTEGLPSSKDLTGKDIFVTAVWRKPSDKDSATGSYLLCEAQDRQTKEAWTFTAGGEQSVATLAKLHTLGALPAMIRFELVDTRSGNKAINCKVIDSYGPNAT